MLSAAPRSRPRGRAARLAAIALACGLCSASAGPAGAQERVQAAGVLYDQAVEAQRQGEYARAASLFARADELSPAPAALEAALGAALLADDPVLGMTLVQRSSRGATSKSLAAVVRAAQAKFADRVGILRVACGGCTVFVDGERFPVEVDRWVTTGRHEVELTLGDRSEKQSVRVPRAERVEVGFKRAPVSRRRPAAEAIEAPPPPATPDQPETEGISQAWFWGGAGLTAVFAVVSLVSGFETLRLHDEFLISPTAQKAADGQAAETRTYALVGVTAGLLVGTALIGILAVEWSSPDAKVAGAVAPIPGGAAASFVARF